MICTATIKYERANYFAPLQNHGSVLAYYQLTLKSAHGILNERCGAITAKPPRKWLALRFRPMVTQISPFVNHLYLHFAHFPS